MAKKTTAKQNTNNGESKFKGIRNFYQRADPFYYRIGYFHCYHICRSGIDFVFFTGGADQSKIENIPLSDLVINRGSVENWTGCAGLFLPIC